MGVLRQGDSPPARSKHDHGEEKKAEIGLVKKVMLNGLLAASEGSFTFEQLYTASGLQRLGLPMSLVSTVGLMSGPVATLVILLLGWLSDRGPNPNRRKLVAVVLCSAVLLAGIGCVMLANALDLRESGPQHHHTRFTDNMSIFTTRWTLVSQETTAQSDATERTPSSANNVIPFTAGLALLGFVLMDTAFNCTTSFARSYALACSPFTEHTSLLNVGVVMCALGTIPPAALGMVNWETLLQGSGVSAETFIQGSTLTLMVVLGASVVIVTGSRLLRLRGYSIVPTSDETGIPSSYDDGNESSCSTEERNLLDRPPTETSCSTEERDLLDRPSTETSCSTEERDLLDRPSTEWTDRDDLTDTVDQEVDTRRSESDNFMVPGETASDTNTVISSSSDATGISIEKPARRHKDLQTSSKAKESSGSSCCQRFFAGLYSTGACCLPFCGQSSRRGFKCKVAAICIGTYFSVGAIFLFDYLTVDYVGKVIYGGSPTDEEGSPGAERYQTGKRMSSFAFLVYNVAFVCYSFLQVRVLSWFGYKREFIIHQMIVGGSFILLAVTSHVVALFVLASAAGMRRASVSVVPYKLINDVMHEETKRSGKSVMVGTTVSLVAVTFPLAANSLYPWVGAVVQALDCSATPLWIAAGYTALSALIFVAF